MQRLFCGGASRRASDYQHVGAWAHILTKSCVRVCHLFLSETLNANPFLSNPILNLEAGTSKVGTGGNMAKHRKVRDLACNIRAENVSLAWFKGRKPLNDVPETLKVKPPGCARNP